MAAAKYVHIPSPLPLVVQGSGPEVPLPSLNPTDALKDHIINNAWLQRTVTGSLGAVDELLTKIKSADWNTCHIVAKGNRLQHYINGILTSDVTDNDPVNAKSAGLIGMQVHVGPPMKVAYRNIRLKEIK